MKEDLKINGHVRVYLRLLQHPFYAVSRRQHSHYTTL